VARDAPHGVRRHGLMRRFPAVSGCITDVFDGVGTCVGVCWHISLGCLTARDADGDAASSLCCECGCWSHGACLYSFAHHNLTICLLPPSMQLTNAHQGPHGKGLHLMLGWQLLRWHTEPMMLGRSCVVIRRLPMPPTPLHDGKPACS
jgi:hypothetical protein